MRQVTGGFRARLGLGVGFCAAAMLAAIAGTTATPPRLPAPEPPDFSSLKPYTVADVTGPTEIVVQMGGDHATVRLIGTYVPKAGDGRAAATRFLKRLLVGESVYVAYEPDWPLRDRENRIWAYVYRAPEGLFVNLELLRQGYARFAAASEFKSRTLMETYERHARRLQKGLWDPDYAKATAPPNASAPAKPKPPETPETASTGEDDNLVYVTEHGKKYHRKSCRYAGEASRALRVEEAKAEGFTPCKLCKPPE